ncbi:MAG: ADP-ribosylglycohydrolase family protein [Blastocatellia bacterium]|nr:ADP-ribosylglycohydrolase family protein [Blastocatellia bacterium]
MEKRFESKVVGCLVGGAVGDALGAPFEGLWAETIPEKDELLAGYALYEGFPTGQYTDDTQLTLATVESILRCRSLNPADIARSIFSLWRTEGVIGPGGACSQAARRYFATPDWTTCGAPPGNAGNGAAMRTAILGLCYSKTPQVLVPGVTDISLITHQDARSIAGGVAIAQAAFLLLRDDKPDPFEFCHLVAESIRPIEPDFSQYLCALPEWVGRKASVAMEQIAWAGMRYPEFHQPIITPFVIPTVLAALWCVLRHPCHWEEAVAAAIQLGGDVDTLGAIVGGLMGARLGITAIPTHLVAQLVQRDRIRNLGLALAQWIETGC